MRPLLLLWLIVATTTVAFHSPSPNHHTPCTFKATIDEELVWTTQNISTIATPVTYPPLVEEKDDSDDYHTRFGGVARLFDGNDEALLLLRQATVVVVGVGGVGSWAAESLIRSGVGHVVLVDLDDICRSNTNRQVHALTHTIGQFKVEAMRQRLHAIHPQATITIICDYVTPSNVQDLMQHLLQHDNLYILDAMDTRPAKVALMAACVEHQIPILTCGGAAGKRDATQIVVHDLVEVGGDSLLRSCRTQLRQDYGFAAGVPRSSSRKQPRCWNIPAVYSQEQPVRIRPDERMETITRRPCEGALGTACHVTGTFGLVAAQVVVEWIVSENRLLPRRG